jgi:hypothetical protein
VSISFVAASDSSGSSTSGTIAIPGSAAVGHFMIMAVVSGGNIATAPQGVTEPFLAGMGDGGTLFGLRLYTKELTALDISRGTFDWAYAASSSYDAVIAVYSGVDSVAATGRTYEPSPSSSTVTSPSVAWVQDGLLVALFAADPLALTLGAPLNQRAYKATSGTLQIALADENLGVTPNPPVTGTRTATSSSPETRWAAATLGLKPKIVAFTQTKLSNPLVDSFDDSTIDSRYLQMTVGSGGSVTES